MLAQRLVAVGDRAHLIRVFCKLHCMIVSCKAITCETGEPVLAVMAWDEMPWTLTDCGLFVKKVRSQLQGEGFSPNSSSLLTEVCGVIGLKAELKSRKSSMTYCRNPCCPRRWGQSGWQLTLRQTQTDSSWKHTHGGATLMLMAYSLWEKTCRSKHCMIFGVEDRQSTVICAFHAWVVENVSRFSIDIAENSTWAQLQFLAMLMFSKCW